MPVARPPIANGSAPVVACIPQLFKIQTQQLVWCNEQHKSDRRAELWESLLEELPHMIKSAQVI